jgi:hypothetical protein
MAECGAGHASDDYLVFEAVNSLTEALDNQLRDEVVDGLSEYHRENLFKGYVLQEHYDSCVRELYKIRQIDNKPIDVYERN